MLNANKTSYCCCFTLKAFNWRNTERLLLWSSHRNYNEFVLRLAISYQNVSFSAFSWLQWCRSVLHSMSVHCDITVGCGYRSNRAHLWPHPTKLSSDGEAKQTFNWRGQKTALQLGVRSPFKLRNTSVPQQIVNLSDSMSCGLVERDRRGRERTIKWITLIV